MSYSTSQTLISARKRHKQSTIKQRREKLYLLREWQAGGKTSEICERMYRQRELTFIKHEAGFHRGRLTRGES